MVTKMVIRKASDMKDTPHKGMIKDITFNNMIIRGDSFLHFSGLAENNIENLSLSNIQCILMASEVFQKRNTPEKLKSVILRTIKNG